jgi:hypothetical protein
MLQPKLGRFINQPVTSKLCLDIECEIIRHLEQYNIHFPFLYKNDLIFAVNVMPDNEQPGQLKVIWIKAPNNKNQYKPGTSLYNSIKP